jgi:GntR family transcriptional regulator/MocR family aminotransferase
MPFISSGHLERHIVRMRHVYPKRRHVLIAELRRYFQEQVEIIGDATGLHLVARFPRVTFTPEIVAAMPRAGVYVYPSTYFTAFLY